MRRILVIDDEPGIRESLKRSFRRERERWSVEFAEDGQKALDRLEIAPSPDLILCDILMPGIGGYDVLKKVREDPATEGIPFIFMSGMAGREDLRRGMELGADDYLTKPFTIAELIGAVETRLDKRRATIRQAERSVDDLRRNISSALPHEFRTPLSAILGGSEILSIHGSVIEPGELTEIADLIHDSALRLHRLIENYLLMMQIESKIRTGSVGGAPREPTIDAWEIVADAARNAATAANREKDLRLDATGETARVSPEHLDKIVEETVGNGFKYSDDGETVTVESRLDDGWLLFRVTNRGRGMTENEIARIGAFTQFGRERYEQKGAGLGLAIASGLVRLCGGTFRIESRPGEETILSIALPA